MLPKKTGESYEDLTVNNNVPCREILKNLSSRLEKYMLKGTERGSEGNRMVSMAQ